MRRESVVSGILGRPERIAAATAARSGENFQRGVRWRLDFIRHLEQQLVDGSLRRKLI